MLSKNEYEFIGEHKCRICSSKYMITEDLVRFLSEQSPVINGKKYDLPIPGECPTCRMQRRLAFRNERNLYKNKCYKTGEEIVTRYSPMSPYKVYSYKNYLSDDWDAITYGRDYDFTRSFFDQYKELQSEVPRQPLTVSYDAIDNNCLYVNFAGNNKNCYLIFDSDFNQDSLFSNVIKHSKNCVDCSYIHSSEILYECKDCENSYALFYSQDCSNCRNSFFLNNCIGCYDCMFCCNLQQKQYHIKNKAYSKEEYFEILKSWGLDKYSLVEKARKEFADYSSGFPKKYSHQVKTDNCTGNYITNSKNCIECFDISKGENLSYCDALYEAKSCMDVSSFGEGIERVYESTTIGLGAFNISFSLLCVRTISDFLYCDECVNSKNLFGCIGLRKKQYCILNKQYTKEEYESLVPKIIEHMQSTEEWGKFFSNSLSLCGYNESVAQEYFPLTKEMAIQLGYNWSDYEAPFPEVKKTIPADKLPETIKDIPDDVCNWAILCEDSGKPFKITMQELGFYREYNIPLPRKHWDIRHQIRMGMRTPRKLWDRECSKCGVEIKSAYDNSRAEKIFCEKCYLNEVF